MAVGFDEGRAEGFAKVFRASQKPEIAATVETLVVRAGEVPRPNVLGV